MPFQDYVQTPIGGAEVITKKCWMGFVPMPHTSVLPYPCRFGELKSGTVIKWDTSDKIVLYDLHKQICGIVEAFGVAGMTEIANSVKMTGQVWNQFGGSGSGIQEMTRMAAEEGVDFPLPPYVLKHLKGFQ